MKRSSSQRPLILTDQPSTKLFAYYTVRWEHKQTSELHHITDSDVNVEINSCLYFQSDAVIDDDDDERDDIRKDGSGYVITYPAHLRPDDHAAVYNFDRPSRQFLLTSDDVYVHSKTGSIFLSFAASRTRKDSTSDFHSLNEDRVMKQRVRARGTQRERETGAPVLLLSLSMYFNAKVSNKWRIDAFNLSTGYSFSFLSACACIIYKTLEISPEHT